MRFPLRSAKLLMPALVLAYMPAQNWPRLRKTGMADQSHLVPSPRSMASRVSEIDISEQSNSSYLRLRKKSNPPPILTTSSLQYSGWTVPSAMGAILGLSEKAQVSVIGI